MDESTIESSRFYLLVIGYLQDMTQSIGYISRASYNHVNNNHKNLKKSQISDLKSIDGSLSELLAEISKSFSGRRFDNLKEITSQKDDLFLAVTKSIQKQVERIRTEESSAKNTTLYFSNLLETKDLIEAIMNLLELYQEFQINIKKSYVSAV